MTFTKGLATHIHTMRTPSPGVCGQPNIPVTVTGFDNSGSICDVMRDVKLRNGKTHYSNRQGCCLTARAGYQTNNKVV